MSDFLLEIASEEIPARMQAAAAEQLRTRFVDGLKAAGLAHGAVTADATPRRLWLIAEDVAAASAAQTDERKGPAASAPEAAIAGFLRSTGLTREQLEERDSPKGKVLFAVIARPGRGAADILAELVPMVAREFQWPKSMRWGAASATTASARWVRPLTGLVALLDGDVVPCAVHGVASARETRGHRIHAPAPVAIESAATYAAQLRAAHVIAASADRRALIEAGAAQAAAAAGLSVIPDAGLVAENAGLTEWPVPMLGGFDPAYLAVPREVIQLTMRTNQKYFALADAAGALAPNFVCVANLEASDGGKAIVAGNERVLSARLSDAKFFWDQDVAAVSGQVGLGVFSQKLENIVFHEKLGTVADKVERVAKLARWLVESGAISSPPAGEVGLGVAEPGEGASAADRGSLYPPAQEGESPSPSRGEGSALAALAEQAARLCKADLVSATVGEFPEVQGIAGAYLARVAGLDPQVADAIRDHYKPVGQGDDVPTAPVSVAVALADKLDTLFQFFMIGKTPTGSRDPFALRRQAIGSIGLILHNSIRIELSTLLEAIYRSRISDWRRTGAYACTVDNVYETEVSDLSDPDEVGSIDTSYLVHSPFYGNEDLDTNPEHSSVWLIKLYNYDDDRELFLDQFDIMEAVQLGRYSSFKSSVQSFFADRLKVQQREAGVRHDLIDAVFALGGEDDLVRLLTRVKALQAFIATDDGANLLAGYKRAANILRIESARDAAAEAHDHAAEWSGAYTELAEASLAAALDAALPMAAAAVAAEDFEGAMAALAGLRAPVDRFFADVMVNDPDPAVRVRRLALLARFRDAVHAVADFSRIEG